MKILLKKKKNDQFQFIGGMKVGEPSADGRGSAPPELAEQQARAYVKPSPAPIIPYTQAIRFTVLSEYKAPKRSMPLKTVFCFRSSENVPWHLKARETRERRKPRQSLQNKKSYAQICSAPYLTTFAHRSRRFPATQTIYLQTTRHSMWKHADRYAWSLRCPDWRNFR